jgi:hypothetical protein
MKPPSWLPELEAIADPVKRPQALLREVYSSA